MRLDSVCAAVHRVSRRLVRVSSAAAAVWALRMTMSLATVAIKPHILLVIIRFVSI